MFFSSRGNFDRPAGTTVSTDDRLSSEGWQSCASCHFKGLTDGVVWQFARRPAQVGAAERDLQPEATATDQRVLNYSAIFDEVEDFEAEHPQRLGPRPARRRARLRDPPPPPAPPTSTLDPNHGLLIGDNGDSTRRPARSTPSPMPNADRQQVTVTLPGSTTAVPALTAMREWVRAPCARRTARWPQPTVQSGALAVDDQRRAARSSIQAGCASCHGGVELDDQQPQDFTLAARRDRRSSPSATPPPIFGNPVGQPVSQRASCATSARSTSACPAGQPDRHQHRRRREGHAPRCVNGRGCSRRRTRSASTTTATARASASTSPSLLGIHACRPTTTTAPARRFACVLSNARHRTANNTRPDVLANPADQAAVVAFLESIDVKTPPVTP